MNTCLVVENGDMLYNELPIKCTVDLFNDSDCVLYRDLPTLMNDMEKKLMSGIKAAKPTLEQAAEDFKCGCKEAFNYLYEHYYKKIRYVANRYNDEDLVQELSMVLHHCTEKYEAGGSSGFNTLFWTAAQHHMSMIRVRRNSLKRKNKFGEVSLNMVVGGKDSDEMMENVIEDRHAQEPYEDMLFFNILKNDILPKLSSEDKQIVSMIVGSYTIKEIADKLNINTAIIYMRLKRLREKRGVGEILKSLQYKMNMKVRK